MRAGQQVLVKNNDVVVGDVLLLDTGDKVRGGGELSCACTLLRGLAGGLLHSTQRMHALRCCRSQEPICSITATQLRPPVARTRSLLTVWWWSRLALWWTRRP